MVMRSNLTVPVGALEFLDDEGHMLGVVRFPRDPEGHSLGTVLLSRPMPPPTTRGDARSIRTT